LGIQKIKYKTNFWEDKTHPGDKYKNHCGCMEQRKKEC
jgi:hypothetical protein